MASLQRAMQGLILFSTILGVAFLWQAYPLLPTDVFYALLFGWSMFVVDSVLTFFRPRASYILGMALAAVALIETLGQPEHYSLVQSGELAPTLTIILGSGSQILLIVLVAYFFVKSRKKDPWAWPNGETPPEPDEAPAPPA